MVRRSRDTGAITQWQYECACKEISVKKWRIKEPYALQREDSKVHDLVLSSMSKQGTTPEIFAYDLGLSLRQLEIHMPLASKYHEVYEFGQDEYDLKWLGEVEGIY